MKSEDWLNQMIWCGFSDYVPRRVIISQFTKYGLIPFLTSHGYSLQIDTKEFSCKIASLLFHNRGHMLITPIKAILNGQDDYSVEHKQHYNHVLDPAQWSTLWEAWSFWEDVSLESGCGFYRRIDVQEYCWSQIDLASSKQTRVVEEYIEGGELSMYANVHNREDYDEY